MKYPIIIMALLLFGTARAQDSTYVTESKYEKLADKYIGQFSGALESLAETLEQPVTQVYGIYRRQVLIEGMATLSLILIFITALSVVSIRFAKAARNEADEDEGGGYMIVAVICGLVVMVTFCILIYHNGYLTHIMNPDYYVIQKLIDIVK